MAKQSKNQTVVAQEEPKAPEQKPAVLDIIIRIDMRDGEIVPAVFGGELEPAMIIKVLDQYKDFLRQQEIETYKKKIAELEKPNGA